MIDNCPKCHGTGVIKEANGTIHTCWDCLQNGRLDIHSDNVPDSKVKV